VNKENLPIYRHVTALVLVVLVFCYILFYFQDVKDNKKEKEK
jgi:uncharacterized membrane protein